MNLFRILDVPPDYFIPPSMDFVFSRQAIYILGLLIGEIVAFLVTYKLIRYFAKNIEKQDAAFIALNAEIWSLLAGYFVWWLLGLI